MAKLKHNLRRALGLHKLYRRSGVLSFLVDHSREARLLLRDPQQATDQAHRTGIWDFDAQVERDWQRHVLATVTAHMGRGDWGDVLEIGCSEGAFTAELAHRCHSVAAYDISPVAVARAAERCGAYSNVRIMQGDAASEAIEGQYDLVFVMDILWYVVGHTRQSSVIPSLAKAVREGGLVVFSDSRMPRRIRHRFWSLVFPTGADEWARLLESAPELTVVHKEGYRYQADGQLVPGYWDKLFVLFRKQTAASVKLTSPSRHDNL